MTQSKHNRNPLAQEIWELATAMNRIRQSEAHYRIGANPHVAAQDRADYAKCNRCGDTAVIRPLDDGPGICPVCDEPREWEN